MFDRSIIVSHFMRGISRAEANIALFEYLKTQAPEAFDISDILRGAIVIASSAFDLLHHQMIRALTYKFAQQGTGQQLVSVPVGIFNADQAERLTAIDSAIRSAISHKSFLMPDKISQIYANFIPNFWSEIANKIENQNQSSLMYRVKELGRWRNRIVHESDIDPHFSGISEWPIFAQDARCGVQDYKSIGLATVDVGFTH